MTPNSMSDAVLYAMQRQRAWSVAASGLFGEIRRWHLVVLWLSVLGAILIPLGDQLVPVRPTLSKVLRAVGAAILALVPVILTSRLSRERVKKRSMLREASESIKSEVYRYLAKAGPYQNSSRDTELLEKVKDIEKKAAEAARGEALSWDGDSRPLPSVSDVNTYVEMRVVPQIDWHRGRINYHQRRTRSYRNVLLGLAFLGAVFAALALNANLQGLAVWVPVTTTVTTSLTAYLQETRLEDVAYNYNRTAQSLEQRLLEWRMYRSDASDLAAYDAKFIADCEEVLLTVDW